MTETIQIDEQRVALGCLGCYNEGRLAFRWFNAEQLEIIWEEGDMKYDCMTEAVCKQDDPTHEEWMIQDYDGEINRLNLGEHPFIENLIAHMKNIEEFEPSTYVPAYLLTGNYISPITPSGVEEMMDEMEVIDRHNLGDWAYELCEDTGYLDGDGKGAPQGWHPMNYIDWKWVAKDMLHDYTYIEYGDYYYARRN